MPLQVVVVTTKPEQNEAEYGVRDTATGQWVRHGIKIPVAVESLAPADQAKLAGARAVITTLATTHAQAEGLI